MTNAKHPSQGFTLMEMLITVAIVGILASIAFPSYRNYVIRANRADAQQTLLQLAQAMERNYVVCNSYCRCSVTGDTTSPCNAITLGPSISPESGPAIYNMSLNAVAANSFTLRATPVTGKVNATDGLMQITQTGAKTWDINNDADFLDAGETTWVK
ncbi:MAG: type IV pilin protein [Pseudomonadota bacterium]